MKRICHWCGKPYDTRTASSIYCVSNPNRGRGAKRIKKRIVVIGAMMLKPNPWAARSPQENE